MEDFQSKMESATFDGKRISVTTRSRGVIIGMFSGVDEFETDPEKLGFWIQTGTNEEDTVFLDEIVSVATV